MSDNEEGNDEEEGVEQEGEDEAAAADSVEEEVSRNFKYATLCEYLDRMQRIRYQDKFGKQRVLKALMAKWSSVASTFTNEVVSFYPIIRIMANSLDGRKFNMKSSANLSIEKLAEEVAQRNPTVTKHELSIYDVNDSLCKITEREMSEHPGFVCKVITVANSYILRITFRYFHPDEGDAELERLLRACATAREVYWLLQVLVRMIARSLKVTSLHLVNWVHPRGTELRQSGVSLRKICDLAAENKMSDDSSMLFRRFEPMLLSKVGYGTANIYDKLLHFCGEEFYVEIKYDGEHFLLHRGPNAEMRYYSRVQNDFTKGIAPVLDHRINPFFAPSVESCILDVELLLWDTIDKKRLGHNTQAADGRVYDVKALRTDSAVEPCVAVFDLLFLNGQPMVNIPLKERIAILQSGNVLQKQDETKIFVSEFKIVKTREQFAAMYEEAVRNGEEGIVAKKFDSFYKPGMRQMINGWFKIKPFHLGDESLDLAIVGVDLGRNGKVSNYSVATLRDKKFFMVGKVGTGLDDTTRNFIKSRLTREHGFMRGEPIPSWIHSDYTTNDLPTNFIHKDNMQVVEIRAKGLRNGRLYAPTLKAYRDDKYVKDIDQYQDFLDFDQNLRVGSIENALSTADPRKRTKALHLPEEYQTKKKRVEEISQDLKGKQICVLRGTPGVTVQELQEIIASFGGTHVAHPGSKTLFVVTGEPKHVRSKAIIKSNKYNVVSTDWLVACKDAGKVIPVTEKETVHVVDDSLYSLFGGSKVTEDSDMPSTSGKYTVASISAMLDKIKVTKRKKPTAAEEELRKQLFKDDKFDRFYGQTFYLHDDLTKIQKTYVRILLRMHGADLSAKLSNNVTHIVVSDRKKAGKDLSKKGTVVDIDWLENTLDVKL